MSSEFKQAEASVEAHSAELKKELGLFDLTLTQILFIVGLGWVGAAGKLGHSHVVFWLTAVALFYAPTAAVVIYLNRMMPLEGGLYQWASIGLSRLVGFMVAWNLWLYVITLTSEIGLQVATNLSYALGPKAAWMATNKWFITLASCLVISLLVGATVFGLGLGKWIHNAGGIMLIVVFAALIALPFIAMARGELASYHPFAVEMPTFSLLNVNILGKMGFAALGGFEYVAILAGECRSPERSVSLSVVVSAPIIALLFILGTSSVVAFLKPEQIDLIAPIPQVLSVGFHSFSFAVRIVPIAILILMGLRVAQASINFTANSRLPMVAGWDRLLPQWFCRLHPKYKTPANSILFVGAMTLAFGVASILGVGEQEAYQLIQSASIIFYGISYLVMLLIPLIGLKAAGVKPNIWIKLAAVSGFGMTLLNVLLSIFPIVQVQGWLEFSLKISGVIVLANGLGLLLFMSSARRREAGEVTTEVSIAD